MLAIQHEKLCQFYTANMQSQPPNLELDTTNVKTGFMCGISISEYDTCLYKHKLSIPYM